jgi:hypothetical protein
MMRLSDFVRDVVATRKLPKAEPGNLLPPAVLMKMDIEGILVILSSFVTLFASF